MIERRNLIDRCQRNQSRTIHASVIASLIATGLNVGIVSASLAGDIAAPVPIYAKTPGASWTGFYLGAGAGFRSSSVDEQTISAVATRGAFVSDLMSASNCIGTLCGIVQSLNGTAFRFSPYFGYNWQVDPQWLVGVEGDVGFGSKTSTIYGVALPGAGLFSAVTADGDSFAVKTSWDASARARVGYLVTSAFLIYATGGAAWQHVQAISTCGPNGGGNCLAPGGVAPGAITDSTTRLGYTLGGGLETLAWNHWLVRGELRYSDFGTFNNFDLRTVPHSTATIATSYNLHMTTATALVGAAYKF